jgi:hypothetical protein
MFAHPGASLSAIWGANEANNNACLNGMCMAFLAVNFGEIFCAMNMRSRMGSIFSKSMFKNMNWWLIGAFVVTVALTMLPILIPPLRDAFFPAVEGGGVQFNLDWNDVIISFCLALSTVPVFELGKAIHRAIDRRKAK